MQSQTPDYNYVYSVVKVPYTRMYKMYKNRLVFIKSEQSSDVAEKVNFIYIYIHI